MRMLAAVVCFTVACGQPADPVPDDLAAVDPAGCPNDLPAQCPTPAPSWSAEVGPLVAERCVVCHGPGGPAAEKPLSTWDAVHRRRGAVLTEVYACKMPPAPRQPLAGSARQQLLGWLVCGAPDN